MTNEAADILRKAKELIETKGWAQEHYAYHPVSGNEINLPERALEAGARVCVYGALAIASRCKYFMEAERSQFESADILRKVVGSNLVDWNDSPRRTKSEVLSAFDRAIALAEAGNG